MLAPISTGASASSRTLAELCDRVAISLEAGIDVRRIWRSETERLRGRGSRAAADVAASIDEGETLATAIADAGPFFPPLMKELVAVGERTGTTTEVFRRLASHYKRQVDRARTFRSAIAFPVLQLVAALVVVAVLILVAGILGDGRGKPLDLLGFGLVGVPGLFVYINLLMGVALLGGLVWMAFRRLPGWSAKCRAIASELPLVGPALRKIALARIAWALRLTMNVDMDLRRVAPVVLRASDNARYARHGEQVSRLVGEGRPLSEAFEQTGVFPRRFLDMLEVAEQSGTIVESMDRLSQRYDEEAESAVELLTRGRRVPRLGGNRHDRDRVDLPSLPVLHRRVERRSGRFLAGRSRRGVEHEVDLILTRLDRRPQRRLVALGVAWRGHAGADCFAGVVLVVVPFRCGPHQPHQQLRLRDEHEVLARHGAIIRRVRHQAVRTARFDRRPGARSSFDRDKLDQAHVDRRTVVKSHGT